MLLHKGKKNTQKYFLCPKRKRPSSRSRRRSKWHISIEMSVILTLSKEMATKLVQHSVRWSFVARNARYFNWHTKLACKSVIFRDQISISSKKKICKIGKARHSHNIYTFSATLTFWSNLTRRHDHFTSPTTIKPT